MKSFKTNILNGKWGITMFWTKKRLEGKDYEEIQKELTDLHGQIQRIQNVIARLDSDNDDIRTRLRRKNALTGSENVGRSDPDAKPQVLNTFNPFSI